MENVTALLHQPITVSLALQGGGAHGAFTWGVLDRLLQEPLLSFDGISATSSGAMNALALAQGWLEAGRDGARAKLTALWETVGNQSSVMRWASATPAGATASAMMLQLTHYFTPKEINPLGINPLRDMANSLFDFERLRLEAPQRLFIAATRVRDGKLTLFDNAQLTIDALLASTCLPQLFAPVIIDDEMYWDGGYAGNPALEPLLYRCDASDILSVLVQPLQHAQPPKNVREISLRIVELGFSTTFLRELDTLLKARESLAGDSVRSWIGDRLNSMRMHLIEPGESLDSYSPKTRINTRLSFLRNLRDLGHAQTSAWLAQHAAALGKRATVKL